MAIPSRQIGWSAKANLLWEISKQLEILTQVAGNNGTTTTTTTVAPTTTTTSSTTSSTSTSTTTTTTTAAPVYSDYEASRFTIYLCPPETGVTLNIGVPGGDIATASIIYCTFIPNFTTNDTIYVKFDVAGTYYTRQFITNNDATSATPTGSPVAC